ncbi:MAG: PAS domain-containing protein [Lachnospiraceae bacterium]
MTKRIFRSICLVALTVFLASVILIMGVLYEYFSSVGQEQLRMQTNLAAQGVTHEGIAYFQDLKVTNYRITWIDRDGNVLYDSMSDTAQMENHLEREEVRQAIGEGYGESRRYSATLLERSFYSAQRLADGTILRLSLSQMSVLTLLVGMAQSICIIFAIALILSIVLAVRISKRIVKPLNQIDLDDPLTNDGYDELSPLLRRIDSQQRQLRCQKEELIQKENELNTIIGSMNEGMILLNQKGRIITVNAAARKLLGLDVTCIGEDLTLLCENSALKEILSEALQGRQAERILPLQEGHYQVDAGAIISQNKVRGAALFLFNVTEKEKTEQIRREFTANVSHELKTPLHSISGYAELLKNDMVREKDRVPFAEKIYDEAQRMIRLVEDIISLSHLDEGAQEEKRENIDLYGLAESVIQALEPQAEAAGVILELCGIPVILNGIPQLLYSMVYNLCDNAIKYNRENGKVTVSVGREGNTVRLAVTDTGIGIAPEHQERIFERFYRVDKSHSKAAGGTGLGLSIVKHAARIHHAKIEVNSTAGVGTMILVTWQAP